MTWPPRSRRPAESKWFRIGRHGSPWTAEEARNEPSRLLRLVVMRRIDLAAELAMEAGLASDASAAGASRGA